MYKIYYLILLVSRNYRFVVWTDASTKETVDGIVTIVGYVIKDRNFPPFCDSNIYYNINNSKGELKAGIESLKFLTQYCDCLNIDTKKCEVELKTDFTELERTINNHEIKAKNLKKFELLKELKRLQMEFKIVKCDEIDRKTNIAHNVCYFEMEKFRKNKGRNNGIVENFYEIYENPKLCVRKNDSRIN